MAEASPSDGVPVQVSTDPALAAFAIINAPFVAIDTETTGIAYQTADLVGVSIYPIGSSIAFYLPVYSTVDPDSAMVPISTVINLLVQLFANPNRTLVFHNALYDLLILRKLGLRCYARIYDTMYAEHRLDNTYGSKLNNKPQVYWNSEPLNYKLKTLTRKFLGQDQTTFDEATGGLPMQMVPVAQAAPYAAGDTYYTAQHFLRQQGRLNLPTNTGLRNVLESYDFPMLPIIVEMLYPGIQIDTDLAQNKIVYFRSQFDKRTDQLAILLGKRVDLAVKGNLRKVLQQFKLPVSEKTSLSEQNLKKLANGTGNRTAKTFIKLVVSRRYIANVLSKFFVPLLKRTDPITRRLYVGNFQSLNETGRFAASNPNIQALQKGSSVRRIIVAEEGRTIVAADFKNIEPRCLAQALLLFLQDQGQSLAEIKLQNRQRAQTLFSNLLQEREFNKPYQEPEELPYPVQSILANFFLNPGVNQDPYRFIAQQAFGIPNPTTTERNRMKTIVLGVIYGKGIESLGAELKLSYGETLQSLNQFATVMPELGVPTFYQQGGEWRRNKPEFQTYKEQVWEMLRHSGEVTSLFGRKRRFAGLYHLRKCERCKITTFEGGKEYEWDVAPVQLWNYTLHAYVYQVKHVKTGTIIGTSTWRLPLSALYKVGSLTKWPFRQISYRTIRRIQVGSDLVHFTPIEDAQRMGFNAVIQATAGDVFKLAILRVQNQNLMQQFSARMITNVHDELVFSVPTPVVPQFIGALEIAMTAPPTPWWTIPIAVDIEVGPNYGQLQDY